MVQRCRGGRGVVSDARDRWTVSQDRDACLAELGFRLPSALKVQEGYAKLMMREAVRRGAQASILGPHREFTRSTALSLWPRDQPELTACDDQALFPGAR